MTRVLGAALVVAVAFIAILVFEPAWVTSGKSFAQRTLKELGVNVASTDGSAPVQTAPSVEEHYYRDSVDTATAPPARFLVEVPARAAAVGGVFVVDTDSNGRILSVTFQQDGERQSKSVYEYAGDAKLPNSYSTYDKDGAPAGKVTIQRDSEGRVLEIDYRTAQGVLTARHTDTYSGNRDDISIYAADGSVTETDEEYFDDTGAEIRSVAHLQGGVRTAETTYDPKRGVVLTASIVDHGKLSIVQKSSYDANDDLTRVDLYDPQGKWYGDNIYANGLNTEKHFKFTDGSSEDINLSYDRRRWLLTSKQYDSGALVCSFQYDRFPNGAVKRTLVLAPNGNLLEEFPNHQVDNVNQDGSSPAGYPRTAYKRGKFW